MVYVQPGTRLLPNLSCKCAMAVNELFLTLELVANQNMAGCKVIRSSKQLIICAYGVIDGLSITHAGPCKRAL